MRVCVCVSCIQGYSLNSAACLCLPTLLCTLAGVCVCACARRVIQPTPANYRTNQAETERREQVCQSHLPKLLRADSPSAALARRHARTRTRMRRRSPGARNPEIDARNTRSAGVCVGASVAFNYTGTKPIHNKHLVGSKPAGPSPTT